MRKCLESEPVTKTLNHWIDLVFGIYNTKEKAIEKDNLFASTVYKN